MLDMSKAFDTVDRAILLKDLKVILNPDELHLIKIILNAKLPKLCFIPNEFLLYLMKALYKENNDHIYKKSTIIISSKLSSLSKHDHRKESDEHFVIYQYSFVRNCRGRGSNCKFWEKTLKFI